MLKADVDGIQARCDDERVIAALSELSDEIRYSDPMSVGALESYESDLSAAISKIEDAVRGKDAEGALDLIKEASLLLQDRNRRLKMLK